MEKLFNLVREVKSMSFATVEGNKPKSRIFDLMDIEDNKLYFLTAKGKKVYKQLKRNPYIALNGMNKNYVSFRIEGKIKLIEDDIDLREKLLDKNPTVREMYKNSLNVLTVLCLDSGIAEIFDLSENLPQRKFYEF